MPLVKALAHGNEKVLLGRLISVFLPSKFFLLKVEKKKTFKLTNARGSFLFRPDRKESF